MSAVDSHRGRTNLWMIPIGRALNIAIEGRSASAAAAATFWSVAASTSYVTDSA